MFSPDDSEHLEALWERMSQWVLRRWRVLRGSH
jgi:hypothetical protein